MPIDIGSLTPQQQLASIYILYYDRAPDPAGFRFWESLLVENIEDNDPDASGMSLEAIATEFSNQQETRDVYDYFDPNPVEEPSALEFLSNVYANLFGRAPDAGGIEFWANELESGAVPTGEILLAIMKGASGTDIDVLNNKIGVALDWHDAAVAAGATAPDSEGLEGAGSALDGVDETPGSVEAAEARTDAFWGAQTDFRLTSGEDRGVDFVGTGGNDFFDATLTQNSGAGGVSNTLSSGDVLNGVGGIDTLDATLVPEFVGTNGIIPIDVQPTTSNIENIEIEARDGGIADAISTIGLDVFEVTLDAKDMTDIQRIGSHFSDGDLKIENLTTLKSSGEARNTDSITVVMEHTENTNSNDSFFGFGGEDSDNEFSAASDLTVLFDEDYLLAGQTSQGEAQFFLLDQDAELRLKNGLPADGRLDEIDKNGIRVEVNGQVVTLAFDGDRLVEGAADEVNTHAEFVAALQPALDQAIADGLLPAGTTVTLETAPNVIFDTDGLRLNQAALQDGSFSDIIPGIKVETGDGSQVTALGYAAPDELTGEFNVFGRFEDEFEQQDEPVSINVELEKVGREGEGGDLIIGGKELTDGGEGIEVFNVSVLGDETKPSWLNNLNSTNDDLDTVNIVTHPDFAGSDSVADLIINELGGAAFGNGFDETDVRVLDATGFEGDLSLFTNLDEFGGGAHSYNLGIGDDNLHITFGSPQEGFFGGAAGDSLSIDTGAGDDTLLMDDDSPLNVDGGAAGAADLEFLNIETGAGADTVWYDADNENRGPQVGGDTTTGEGARISTSGGNDRIYMSDQGDVSIGQPDPNSSDFQDLDIRGAVGDQQEFQLFGGSLQVQINGVKSEWVDINFDNTSYTTSREDIRDAIQAAVNGSTALSGMIEIVELADGGIRARSLVAEGSDFSIDIEGPVANAALIDDGLAGPTDGGSDEPFPVAEDGGWPLLNAQPTLNQVSEAQLLAAWQAWYPGSEGPTPGNSDGGAFGLGGDDVTDIASLLNAMETTANDVLSFNGTLLGPVGNDSDDNVINGGANDDLIVLSTMAVDDQGGSGGNDSLTGNTVQFTGSFGSDTIVNFTSDGTAPDVAPEGELDNNDILDFTSYLDAAAAGRGSSVNPQDARVDEAVPYSFTNLMGAGDETDPMIDHNSVNLWDFSEIWISLNGGGDPTPANFHAVTTSHLQDFFENEVDASDFMTGGGADPTAEGNEFVLLIGKDGDAEISETGTVAPDFAHADNQFIAFKGEVTAYDEAEDTYSVSFTELGDVDMANTDITTLSADEFGFA